MPVKLLYGYPPYNCGVNYFLQKAGIAKGGSPQAFCKKLDQKLLFLALLGLKRKRAFFAI